MSVQVGSEQSLCCALNVTLKYRNVLLILWNVMVTSYVTRKHRRTKTKEQEDRNGKKRSEKQRNYELIFTNCKKKKAKISKILVVWPVTSCRCKDIIPTYRHFVKIRRPHNKHTLMMETTVQSETPVQICRLHRGIL
jgi:hypothetical protein